MSVGGDISAGVVMTSGKGGIGTMTVQGSLIQTPVLAQNEAGAGIKTMTVNGAISAGAAVGSDGTGGIGTMTVKGDVFFSQITATHEAGGIKSLTVNGAIMGGVIIAGTAGVGAMTLKGDSNLTLDATGKVGTVTLTGTPASPINVSGIFDVKVLSSLTGTNANLDGLTVRATDGIGTVNVRSMNNVVFSAGTLANITTSKDVTGSTLLAGYDIGTDDYAISASGDGTFGGAKGNIGAIMIGGSMSGSSIAANVHHGGDRVFGNGNDVVLAGSLEGAIKSLTVKGAVAGGAGGPGIQFGIVGRTIGAVTIAGVKVTPAWISPDGQVALKLV